MSFRFYLLSGAAGVSSLMGSRIVGWAASKIDRFWFLDVLPPLAVGGQIALAFITSALILLSGYRLGFIRRS